MSQDKILAAVSMLKKTADIKDLISSIDGTFQAVCTNSDLEPLKSEIMQHSIGLKMIKDFLILIQD